MDSTSLRRWIEFRRNQLAAEQGQSREADGLGAARAIQGAADRKFAHDVLNELKAMADWFDRGSPEYVPPLTEEQLKQWRFVRDHNGDVPEHILKQL
jgi:hypothetical protein